MEYVENGLDAGAKYVNINYVLDPIWAVTSISVSDTGHGIDFVALENKFWVFADSQKQRSKFSSSTTGKDGIWRLSFITFAQNAKWKTIYKKDEVFQEYEINVSRDNPEDLEWSDIKAVQPIDGIVGTIVEFTGIDSSVSEHTINNDLRKYLLESISWRLLLTGARLYLNWKLIDPEELIQKSEDRVFDVEWNSFNVRFVKWHERPKNEESRLYFIDPEGKEKYKLPTSYNRQGDGFHHSLYVRSQYFTEFNFSTKEDYAEDSDESGSGITIQALFDPNDNAPNPKSKIFKALRKELNQWIHDIRKPFILVGAKEFIKEIQESGILVKGDSPFDEFLFENTKEMLEELYLYSPKFLTKQSDDQKAVFVKLVYTVLAEGNTTKVFDILDKVLNLSEEEREQFSKLLENMELSNIIKTVQLINDRLDTIKILEQFVYNESLNANEVRHLQGVISQHYWLFGEEYSLIGEAEPDFEINLTRFLYVLRGYSDEKAHMEDPDKNKEMDLFLCKMDRHEHDWNPRIKNIVVEIKHPAKTIGTNEYNQVMKYMEIISKEPRFNGDSFEWRFYLIGRRHSSFIDVQLESNRWHGQSVILKPERNYIVYYRAWSDIIEENKTRLEYLRSRLELKQKTLHDRTRIESTVDGMERLNNSAKLALEITIPIIWSQK